MDQEFRNKKLFSINDLIAAGLISEKDIENWARYQEAKLIVKQLFGVS
jgi:hypothetical protein